MASIYDWAAKVAREIIDESRSARHGTAVPETRIIAIIATYAEPLVELLRTSRRVHLHVEDDTWYCCGACTHECNNDEADHEHTESCCVDSHDHPKRVQGICDCGADEWNKRVDAVLGS